MNKHYVFENTIKSWSIMDWAIKYFLPCLIVYAFFWWLSSFAYLFVVVYLGIGCVITSINTIKYFKQGYKVSAFFTALSTIICLLFLLLIS